MWRVPSAYKICAGVFCLCMPLVSQFFCYPPQYRRMVRRFDIVHFWVHIEPGRHSGRGVVGPRGIHLSSQDVLFVSAVGILILLPGVPQGKNGSNSCHGQFFMEHKAKPTLREDFGKFSWHASFIPMCFVRGWHQYLNSSPSLPTTLPLSITIHIADPDPCMPSFLPSSPQMLSIVQTYLRVALFKHLHPKHPWG